MKKMMMAFAALCVAGVAGAVNIDWAGGNTGAISGIDFSQSVTVTLTYNITKAPTTGGPSGNIFAVGWNNDLDATDNSVVVRAVPSGAPTTGSIVTNGTNSGSVFKRNDNGTIIATGEHTIVLTFDLSGTTPTITCTIDGTAQTIEFASGSYAITDTGTLKFFKYDQEWVSNVNAEVTYSGAVPEPTALALLALGVAGLALRRKAA